MTRKNLVKAAVFVAGLLTVALFAGGCSADEQVAAMEQALTTAQSAATVYDNQSAAVRSVIKDCQTILADPNLTADEFKSINAVMVKAIEKLDVIDANKKPVMEKIAALQEAIAQVKADGTVETSETIGLWSQTVGSAAPFLGQYAPWATLVSTVLGGIAVVLERRKNKQVIKTETTAVDIVKSVSKLLDAIDKQDREIPDTMLDAEKAKALLYSEQDSATIAAVSAYKAAIKNAQDNPAAAVKAA